MQNLSSNSLSTEELSNVLGDSIRAFLFVQALQADNLQMPAVYLQKDCKVVGGNPTFPPLPSDKIGLMFLSSGTYEAAVVGGADKWRRLYDGTTFDPSTNIP